MLTKKQNKTKNVVRCRGATSFNSSSLINSTQVTIALLNRVRTAGENSTSFLVEDLEKPPFFSLLLIPTGSSPSSSPGLSSNIYNPKSKALLASLWKASRERDLLFPPRQSRRRCSAGESGERKAPAARGAPARSRRRANKAAGGGRGAPRSPRPSRGAPGRASLLARLAPRRRPQRRRERGRAPRSPRGAEQPALAPAPTERGTVPSARARLRPPPPPPRPW